MYTGNAPLSLLGQVQLSFHKSWQKWWGSQKGEAMLTLTPFTALAECQITYRQQCPRPEKQCHSAFKCQNCLQLFTEPSLQDKFSPFILCSFFYPSQTAAALCAVVVRELDGETRGWSLPALPNSCHQGEGIRFSKMISTGQTLPFYAMMNLQRVGCHWLDLHPWRSNTVCLIPLVLSASPSPRALYWATSRHLLRCLCHHVTSTTVR